MRYQAIIASNAVVENQGNLSMLSKDALEQIASSVQDIKLFMSADVTKFPIGKGLVGQVIEEDRGLMLVEAFFETTTPIHNLGQYITIAFEVKDAIVNEEHGTDSIYNDVSLSFCFLDAKVVDKNLTLPMRGGDSLKFRVCDQCMKPLGYIIDDHTVCDCRDQECFEWWDIEALQEDLDKEIIADRQHFLKQKVTIDFLRDDLIRGLRVGGKIIGTSKTDWVVEQSFSLRVGELLEALDEMAENSGSIISIRREFDDITERTQYQQKIYRDVQKGK